MSRRVVWLLIIAMFAVAMPVHYYFVSMDLNKVAIPFFALCWAYPLSITTNNALREFVFKSR